jgi:hypothetical protein
LDNDRSKWGKTVEGVIIYPPGALKDIDFDYILICVNDFHYDHIYSQLRNNYGIDENRIKHRTFWQRKEFLEYYCSGVSGSFPEDISQIIKRVEMSDRLAAFNYDYVDEYDHASECFYDGSCGLFYSLYGKKRLYLSRKYPEKRQAECYVDSLLVEQDIRSPHRYIDESFTFDGGCILDAGAAEGNFSLGLVEKADKIIMVEADRTWNEAIERTFYPWKDKLVIINRCLSDEDNDDCITINTLGQKYDIDFIKMDIEGSEVRAVRGGTDYFNKKNRLKMAVCTYHNLHDEHDIRSILEPLGYSGNTTGGFMVFPDNMEQETRLVKGVLRIGKGI